MGYAVLPHPPYSTDLVPIDYALFHAAKKPLRGHRFKGNEELHKEWFREDIEKIPEHWQRCTDLGGEYTEHAKV